MPNPSPLGTAIVTGASSGIGKVYAERLADRGYDLVLVARRAVRLREIVEDLKSRYGIRAESFVADLSERAGVDAVRDRIADEAVSLVVNNAGFSTLKDLTGTPDDVASRMIALNVTALTLLSKAALIAFKARGSGTLVNVGSGAGFSPYPGIPVYGATKAYVYLFTQSLQTEVAGTDVRVQLVLPGAVVSEGWDVAGGAALEPLPPSIVMATEDCVDAALAGLDKREPVTAPSLQDAAALRAHESSTRALLESMFNAQPAERYGIRG